MGYFLDRYEDGRRKKEEGRRKMEEGRWKMEDGRRKKEDAIDHRGFIPKNILTYLSI
ncbi:hypothetical protein IQ269_13125 [Tychonema sp. LEGE 07199]|uniref:hypothetical protein n=1 Tax=unclassified Tychonema TaxID=2642144 RepID=UPI00187F1ED1|nr:MULTISPECIES: hypothetical protein [unclassified Tychonema]MBE9121718.1 hypothetical protein [Tychonema sp. LEGE 07199]MBE9135247.1 hypothetical protein [Tychonema sp. LEGE 07196]